MVDLTPGSRRKLLRHIDEGRHINELSGLMQISRPAMRKIILADDELSQACKDNGTLTNDMEFVVARVEASRVPEGLNPSFVRKVWSKRRKEAEREAIRQREMDRNERHERVAEAELAADAAVAFRTLTIRTAGDPVEVVSCTGEPIILDSKPTIRKIIEDVIRGTSVTYEDIIGKRRTHDIIPLRHTAIANAVAIRQDLSLPTIGRLFGGRDHTTILHAAQKMGVSNRRLKSHAAPRAA
ncbi:helix-turn-helix domain-containing protein [Brucella pseudogrignonensis]|uniref:helix-turn-helix domain-containing protein n=1 Tax=Brucella pseudogrignonensis TaxID=419475 RepID=UPI0028BC0092|nr:helix-turn-helix domain-containing protein [Brucella pseudogrignonensis]MDT6940764.1 helix-turn-helix domain-containing protein [Brucella pseudogrignonensis]